MNLHFLDWAIIVIYLVGCMTAGLWMRRYVRGVADFAVAGREMDVNLGIASLAATELGLVTIMYTAEQGFLKGFAGATIGVLMALAMYFVGRTGFVIGPLRRAGVMTIPELFEKNFGKGVRWLAGLFVVLGGLLNMAVFLRVGGEFLVHFTGMPPKCHIAGHEIETLVVVMIVLLALVLIYTVLGGMLSVLVTDYLQFLVMGFGIVVVSLWILKDFGWNWNAIVQTLWYRFDGTTQTPLPLNSHPFNPLDSTSFGWKYVLWQAVFQIAVVTTWQTQISRVLSAKDEETAKRMYRRSAFYFVGRFALPVLFGIGAFIYFGQQGGLPAGLDSRTAMPAYLGKILPIGIVGLVVAAMLAAEMSTDSGYLLTWATVIYNDLILPCLKRPFSERTRLLLTRSLVLVLGIFLVFYGLVYELKGNIWDYLAITGSIYLASIFTLLVASLYWKRATRAGAFAALCLGAMGPIAFLFLAHPPQVLTDYISVTEPTGMRAIVKHVVTFVQKYMSTPEIAGGAAFALAPLGMVIGSLLTRGRNNTAEIKA
jgi:solute:Na+ symporter, SSS family